ncbi:L,D-transpeptidase family protein [Shewanella sp. 30m-9]
MATKSVTKYVFFAINLSIWLAITPAVVASTESDEGRLLELKALAADMGVAKSSLVRKNYEETLALLNSEIFHDAEDVNFDASLYQQAINSKEINNVRLKINEYSDYARYQWPKINFIELKLGYRHQEVAKLRWVLAQLGDIKPYSLTAYRERIVDPSLELGIKRFQRRHGCEATGKLDKRTLDYLNTVPTARVEQLQMTLKNLIVTTTSAHEYVEVNLAEFMLRVKKGGVEQLSMPVIVGSLSNSTPLLRTYVSRITINPDWTPPYSIIANELSATVSKSPDYIKNNGFVFKNRNGEIADVDLDNIDIKSFRENLKRYKLVQLPGHRNALGKYRFSIPNKHSIYLHDTPNKVLFNRQNRALSHGCIRLSESAVFAKYLIDSETDVVKNKFYKSINRKSTSYFRLNQKIPIYIVSNSVWVDKEGLLQIRDNF